MVDRFLLDLKLVETKAELSDEHRALMADSAEAYLRAGGIVDWNFWMSLSEDSRAAFIVANEKIWRERCGMIGMASQSEAHATLILSEEDGKDLLAKKALDKLCEDLQKK